MRRREFITLLGGAAAAWPMTARAQQTDRLKRVGILMGYAENDPAVQAQITAFREELQKLRWMDGRNIRIDYRWATDGDHLRIFAAELAAMTPDVILAAPTSALLPVHHATRTIPIVFAQVTDPVANGFVVSVKRPGGNITGFALTEQSIETKRLELLKEIAPRINRVVMVYDPANPQWSGFLAEIKAAAPSFGVQVSDLAVRAAADLQPMLQEIARERGAGLIVVAGPLTNLYRKEIVTLAGRYELPAVYSYRYFVSDGGLASYGVDRRELFRGAAEYVDRILKGEKPGDLPVQFANKFELVINLKAAKALGIEPPISLLARTDEVIE